MDPITIIDGAASARSLAKYFSRLFKTRREAAELAAKNSATLKRLEHVQKELIDLSSKQTVYYSESALLEQAAQNILNLYNNIRPPNVQGTLKERFEACNREYRTAQTLSKLVIPLEASLEIIYTNHSADELKALNDYIVFVKTAYVENQARNIDLVSRLRTFEDKHAGNAITGVIRRYRTGLPRGPDPEVLNFFETTYAKVQGSPPQFSPTTKSKLGSAGSWRVTFERKLPKISAKYGWINPIVTLNCTYGKGKTVPSLNAKKNSFTIDCIVKSGPSSDLADLVKSYNGANSVLYFYDAKNAKLHYNSGDILTELFSGYFDLNKAIPPTYACTLDFIFSKTPDKEKLVSALGAPTLNSLIKKGKVIPGYNGMEPVYVKDYAEI